MAAQDALAAARQVAERISERDRAKAELAKLEARREEFAQKLVQYQRPARRRRWCSLKRRWSAEWREAGAAAEKLEVAKKALEIAANAKTEAETKLERETVREPEREAARQQVLRLEQLGEKVQELATATRAVDAAQKEAAAVSTARVAAETSLVNARGLVDTEQKRAAALEIAYAQLTAPVMKVKEGQAALDNRKALEARRKDGLI